MTSVLICLAAAALAQVGSTQSLPPAPVAAEDGQPQRTAEAPVGQSATLPVPAADAPGGIDSASSMPSHLLAGTDKARHFNRAHDLFIGGGTSADVGGTHIGAGGDTSNDFSFDLDISSGYFVARHIALGAEIILGTTIGSGATQARFALGPLFSARAALAEKVHLLPSLALLYRVNHGSADGTSQTGNYFLIDISAPFVFELGTGVALSVGPYLSPGFGSLSSGDASGTATLISYGIRAGVLGWL